mgnify:CR=1 FL=1
MDCQEQILFVQKPEGAFGQKAATTRLKPPPRLVPDMSGTLAAFADALQPFVVASAAEGRAACQQVPPPPRPQRQP